MSLRGALEAALRENPDDLAAHMAYGDHLAEQGDPRGEFIQTQLALEQAWRADHRAELEGRERALLADHVAGWLGGLEPSFREPARTGTGPLQVCWTGADRFTCTFRRGWLHRLAIERCDEETLRAILGGPAGGLLADLVVAPDARLPHLPGLLKGMTALERLDIRWAGFDDVAGLLSLPLRRLHTLTLHEQARYPLERLAANDVAAPVSLDIRPSRRAWAYPAVTNVGFSALVGSRAASRLESLVLHYNNVGDAGMAALAASANLARLRLLDLTHGRVSDAGARALAASPHLGEGLVVHLGDNPVTEAGAAALRAFGVRVETWGQRQPRPRRSHGEGGGRFDDIME